MNKMTQHEKTMKALEALRILHEFFDKGLSEKECTKLGGSLIAVHALMAEFDKRVDSK